MTKLIGLTGLAKSGKDTFAQGLVDTGWGRLAFADALKEVTALVANEPAALYHDERAKECIAHSLGVTRRVALQNVGKSMRDAVGPLVWVNRALRQWRDGGKYRCVITDVRYDNEAEAILAEGGTIIRIVRDGAGLQGAAGQHESERGIDPRLVRVTIPNNGTVEELQRQAADWGHALGWAR